MPIAQAFLDVRKALIQAIPACWRPRYLPCATAASQLGTYFPLLRCINLTPVLVPAKHSVRLQHHVERASRPTPAAPKAPESRRRLDHLDRRQSKFCGRLRLAPKLLSPDLAHLWRAPLPEENRAAKYSKISLSPLQFRSDIGTLHSTPWARQESCLRKNSSGKFPAQLIASCACSNNLL